MAFGQVDYSGPERIKSAFQTVNDLMFRNKQAEVQVAQDQADRANAAQALTGFQAAIQPDEEGKPRSNEEVYQVAAETSSRLAQSGGRHSQRAAKEVMDYLDARIKMNPPKKQIPPMFKEVAPEGVTGPKLITENRVQYEENEYMDVTTGTRVPGSRHFSPHNPPSSLFGGLGLSPERNIGGVTEEDDQGTLRIKRVRKTGKPIQLTRAEVQRLQQQESDNLRQLQARKDYLENQRQLAMANLGVYQSMATEDPENEMIVQQINNQAADIRRLEGELQQTTNLHGRSASFLKELDVYDPNAAYPTGGPVDQGPESTGFASKKKNRTRTATQ